MSMFYNIVKEYAEAFVKQRPDSAENNSTFCAIFTNKHDVFTGVTGTVLRNGTAESVPAESLAIDAMTKAGQTTARQMISLSLADMSVVKPENDSVSRLINADSENGRCEIYIDRDNSVKAEELVVSQNDSPETAPDEFMEGFDGQSDNSNPFADAAEAYKNKSGRMSESAVNQAELGAPADFSDGVDIDITNPFYEPPTADTKAVATIATISDNSGDSAPEDTAPKKSAPTISKEDLLKQAKKKKKIAKSIFSTKRK